jgi:hypothetical protein
MKKFLSTYSWIIYLSACLGFAGININTWKFWAIIPMTIILEGIKTYNQNK